MIDKGSRYASGKPFTSTGGEEPAFVGIRSREIEPAPGVLEYTIKEGDRLDLLSQHFYNNPRSWWRIADANPLLVYGPHLTFNKYVGETILIPRLTPPRG